MSEVITPFQVETVWYAQHKSRRLQESVWDPGFLSALLSVLRDGLWREYPTEAFGRPCSFAEAEVFLTDPDGLAWPDVPATVRMIEQVAKSDAAAKIRLDADHTAQSLAVAVLGSLGDAGISGDLIVCEAQKMLTLGSPTFAKPGRPSKEAEGNLDKIKVTDQGEGGTSAAYLAARLKKAGRDDLLEQIGPGKAYTSMRAAAIEAGIIKPVPSVRLTDPAKVADKIRQHWPPEQITALVEALL